MKKLLFTFCILCLGLCISAQTKSNPTKKINKSVKTDKKSNVLKSKAAEKTINGSLLDKPIASDHALSKCERHMRYHKAMWKALLNSNPSVSNPLLLTSVVGKLWFVPADNALGNIVVDKTSGSLPIPEITNLNPLAGYNPFPVPVSGTTVLYEGNNANTTISMNWETGNYGTIKEVLDIYKVGTQNFIDVVTSSGVNRTIKIFPGYLVDGCQIPVR